MCWSVNCCGFTSLSDELHAAIWGAGDEAVTQVPTRQLPRIYASQPVHRPEHIIFFLLTRLEGHKEILKKRRKQLDL